MKITEPNILILDLETSPDEGLFWGPGKQYITHDQITRERQIICASWKWLNQGKVRHIDWGKDADDRRILDKICPVVEQADMVIAHNLDRFDFPWIRGRLLYHDMEPLARVRQFDTLKECRKTFKLNSNALDYVSKFIGREGKTKVGYQLWKDLMATNRAKDRKIITDYCDGDVLELEAVYLAIRPHLINVFNLSIFHEDNRICPSCGGNLHKHDKRFYTNVGKKQRYKCQDCGATPTSGRNLITGAAEYPR